MCRDNFSMYNIVPVLCTIYPVSFMIYMYNNHMGRPRGSRGPWRWRLLEDDYQEYDDTIRGMVVIEESSSQHLMLPMKSLHPFYIAQFSPIGGEDIYFEIISWQTEFIPRWLLQRNGLDSSVRQLVLTGPSDKLKGRLSEYYQPQYCIPIFKYPMCGCTQYFLCAVVAPIRLYEVWLHPLCCIRCDCTYCTMYICYEDWCGCTCTHYTVNMLLKLIRLTHTNVT